METEFGEHLCADVMERVMVSEIEDEVLETEGEEHHSFAWLLQCYRENVTTAFKKSGISEYPLHIMFMNVSYQQGRNYIINGCNLLASLPEEIEKAQGQGEEGQLPTSGKDNLAAAIWELNRSIAHFSNQNHLLNRTSYADYVNNIYGWEY